MHVETEHGTPCSQCDSCDYLFETNEEFEKHKLVHEGNKRINCNQCEFKCFSVKAYITHILDVHGSNDEVAGFDINA